MLDNFCAKFFVVFFSTLTTPHEKYNKYLFIMVIDDSRVNERDRRGKNGKKLLIDSSDFSFGIYRNKYIEHLEEEYMYLLLPFDHHLFHISVWKLHPGFLFL